jgi:hypothetical protein
MTHIDTIPLGDGETGSSDCECAMQAVFQIGRERYLHQEKSVRQELRRKIQHGWVEKGEPTTMKEITRKAVRDAFAEAGTQEGAAKRLKLNRGTVRKHLNA